jgi:predicted Zn-dependent peptidase
LGRALELRRKEVLQVRNVIVEERSWSADAPRTVKDQKLSTDPVSAAFLTYGYARI